MSLVSCPFLGLAPGLISSPFGTVVPFSLSASFLKSKLDESLLLFNKVLSNYVSATPDESRHSPEFLEVLELAAELNTPLHSGNPVSNEPFHVTSYNTSIPELFPSNPSNPIVTGSLLACSVTNVFGLPEHQHSNTSLDLEGSSRSSSVDGNPEHMSFTPIVSGSRTPLPLQPDGLYLSSMHLGTPDITVEHVISSPACVTPTVQDAVTLTYYSSDGGPDSKVDKVCEEVVKEGSSLSSRILETSPCTPPHSPDPLRGRGSIGSLGEDEEEVISLPSHQILHLTEGNGREVTVACRVSSLSVVDCDDRQSPPPSSSCPLYSSTLDGHGLVYGHGLAQSTVSSALDCFELPSVVSDSSQSPSSNVFSPFGWHSSLLADMGLDPVSFVVSRPPSYPVLSNVDFPPLSSCVTRPVALPSTSKWSRPLTLPESSMTCVSASVSDHRVMSFICPRRPRMHTPKRNLLLEVLSLSVPPLPKSRCLRLRGGGFGSVPVGRDRVAKKPLRSLPSHPPLRNVVPLPIPQLPGKSLAVADSSLPSGECGLFTQTATDTDELLCLYSGKRLRDVLSITDESPRFDYIWSNRNQTLIIDAFQRLSCFGRYANDALFEHLCNAIIEERNGKVYLISTRPLAANEEIFVNYGAGYWADRFHKFSSDFQQVLVNAYHLVPLPDGTALTPQEAKRRRALSSLPPIPPTPNRPIPLAKLDVLYDTFGSSKNLSLSLALDPISGPAHMHQLMTSLLSNPLTSSVDILKSYLREYHSDVKLQLWLKQDKKHYGACVANGSCGYQFLYQMYLRGIRAVVGKELDDFPTLLSPNIIVGFKEYLEALLENIRSSPHSDRFSVITRLQAYVDWINSPLPRPPIPVWNGWMDAGSVISLAEPDYPFSLGVVENEVPHPFISDLWVLVWSDTKISPSGNFPNFSLGQLEEMLQRNNFGILANSHFYPWPSLSNPLAELDSGLLALAKCLRINFSAVKLPTQLIKRTDIINESVVTVPRAYNTTQEDHVCQTTVQDSLPQVSPVTLAPSAGTSPSSSSTFHEYNESTQI